MGSLSGDELREWADKLFAADKGHSFARSPREADAYNQGVEAGANDLADDLITAFEAEAIRVSDARVRQGIQWCLAKVLELSGFDEDEAA